MLERIIHFVSKDAMNIDGMGEKIVMKFVEQGLIKTLPDIFRLDYDKIGALEKFGKKISGKPAKSY